MFVHLLTCIRAIKGTLIRFLFQAAFEIKINRHLYVHRISFVLVSIGCRVHWPHTLPRLTSEGLSPKLILNHSRQKHMTDSICVLADSCLIVKHWLHCTAPINPVGMWKQREREKKKVSQIADFSGSRRAVLYTYHWSSQALGSPLYFLELLFIVHVSIKYFKCYQSILPLAYKWKCNAPLHYRHNDNGHSRWGELWSNVSPLMVVLKILSYILEVCFSFFLRWWNYCTFQQERDNFSTFPHPWRFPVVILLLPLPQRKETQLQHWIQSKAKENCKNPTLTQKAMKRLKETPGRIKKELI